MSPHNSQRSEMSPEKRDQEGQQDARSTFETKEVLEESKKVDRATYHPEEMVELDRDYKQSEAIEEEFVKLIGTPQFETDAAQPQAEITPAASSDQVSLDKTARVSDEDSSGAVTEMVASDPSFHPDQDFAGSGHEPGVLDDRVEEMGYMEDLGVSEDLLGENFGDLEDFGKPEGLLDDELGDSLGEGFGFPGEEGGIGDQSPGGGGFDDLDSLIDITEDDLELGDTGLPGWDGSLPSNKKEEDLSPGTFPGVDQVSNQGGTSEPDPKPEPKPEEPEPKPEEPEPESEDEPKGSGHYDNVEKICTPDVAGAGVVPVEEPITVRSVAGHAWAAITGALGTDPGADDKPVQGGGGIRGYEDPGDGTGGGYVPTEPGTMPDMEEYDTVEQPLTADSLSQPPVIDEWDTGTDQPSPINWDDAMQENIDLYAHYDGSDVNTTQPQGLPDELKDPDWTLVDPLETDDDNGIGLND